MPERYAGIVVALALAWFGALTGPASRAQEPAIPLVTGEWPPYAGEKLEGGGFAVAVVKAVFAEMGRRSQLKFYPWKRCEAYVQQGIAWATFPYAITPEREAHYLFSDPLFEGKDVWFYYGEKMQSVDYEELTDLRPYTIGGASGYWYSELFREAGLTIDKTSNDVVGLRKLQAGRIDLFPMNELAGVWLINSYFPAQRHRFGILKKPLRHLQNALMVSKNYPNSRELLQEFNGALQRVRAKGIDRQLLEKYHLRLEFSSE